MLSSSFGFTCLSLESRVVAAVSGWLMSSLLGNSHTGCLASLKTKLMVNHIRKDEGRDSTGATLRAPTVHTEESQEGKLMLSMPPKGKLVNFKPLREEWSDYSLSDGTVIRVKVIVTKMLRLQNPDGSPAFTPTGEPAYFFHSQNVVQTLTPAEYKQIQEEESKT